MDINAIVQAISTVGFPIAACCIMFWYLQKEQEAHKLEMNAVTDALNKNTLALTELKDLISLMSGYGGKNDASRESK